MRKILILSGFGIIGLFLIFFITSATIFWFSYTKTESTSDDVEIVEIEKEEELEEENKTIDEREKINKEIQKEAFERGKNQAQKDVQKGKFIVYQNRIDGSSREYRETMLKKYGVKIVEGGDAVSYEEMGYNSGYNSVSIPAIEKKYGKGIIKKVEDDLKKRGSSNNK